MAIRTKKISDLSVIDASSESVILGVNGGTTGKIQLKDVVQFVKTEIKLPETQKSEVTKDDLLKLQNSITKCELTATSAKKASDELTSKYTTMGYTHAQKYEDYDSKIAELETRCTALEGEVDKLISFVSALQGEGYLTLANIKKLAAEHCPICNPSHELEQPTE